MDKLIEFESEFGPILIETEENSRRNTRSFGTEDRVGGKAKERFEQSVDVLQNVSKSIIGKLNNVAAEFQPDEIEIKLGLKFTAEAGAFIAKTSAEGNLEVTIKWANGLKPTT